MFHPYLLEIADIISIFPLVICLGLLYNFLINPDKNILDLILVSIIILANFSVYLIKRLPYPDSLYDITRRPNGAINSDYLSRNGVCPINSPGMPSGHMTTMALFSSFMILSLWHTSSEKNIGKFIKNNIMFIMINIGLVILTAFARYYKKCHTPLQIILGFFYGSFIAYVSFYILHKLKMIQKPGKILKTI